MRYRYAAMIVFAGTTGAFAALMAAAGTARAEEGAESPAVITGTWTANDSLSVTTDPSDDADACLRGLKWEPGEFTVTCGEPQTEHGDRLVQFPSAMPSGNAVNDMVSMEWHVPAGEDETATAPAIVVVHESGSGMAVGRVFANSLRNLGFHTFMIQLPYYGLRRGDDRERETADRMSAMRQAVADVRRARDAVAVLPGVAAETIALQGTSLGSFVSTTAASLDGRYDAVFLMLSGGDLYDILQNGAKDAAKAREKMEAYGIVGEKLKALVQVVEPLRVAHRLDPETTWLYSGLYDKVVPQRNAMLLADAIGLQGAHHVKLPADHYSGVVLLPVIFVHIQTELERIHRTLLRPGVGD